MFHEPSFVILAAGKGTRLGGALPKPLTVLPDGRSILQQQLDNIEVVYGSKALSRVKVVVGHRAEMLAEHIPRPVQLVYNDAYDSSNTAFSLLRGLSATPSDSPTIWMNGDVVFSPLILGRITEELSTANFMAVVPGLCSDEEMKYSLDENGNIYKVSKENYQGVGEAVGINQISAKNKSLFMKSLSKQPDQAYFEAAIQETMRRAIEWAPLDTTGLHAIEVDFAEDLEKVNQLFQL